VRLCEERDLQNDGRTKKELVDALLQWVCLILSQLREAVLNEGPTIQRDQENYASSQDSDASTNSTLSNASTETARGIPKTARLAAASHASRKTSRNTPLLMRAQHPISPEKPRSRNRSKEKEHQEDVNALDLESLQLQDKEIPPDKLTKLELVGSGGFKVSLRLSLIQTKVRLLIVPRFTGRLQGNLSSSDYRYMRHSRPPHRYGHQRTRFTSRPSTRKHCSIHRSLDP